MSGYCFCASENAICWDGFSTASSDTTCQRRKDSKSPVLRSIATRTSTSSLKRFFVAEAIAISRAPNTRSEERRVGKECRSRWSAYTEKKKNKRHEVKR